MQIWRLKSEVRSSCAYRVCISRASTELCAWPESRLEVSGNFQKDFTRAMLDCKELCFLYFSLSVSSTCWIQIDCLEISLTKPSFLCKYCESFLPLVEPFVFVHFVPTWLEYFAKLFFETDPWFTRCISFRSTVCLLAEFDKATTRSKVKLSVLWTWQFANVAFTKKCRKLWKVRVQKIFFSSTSSAW